MSCEPNDFQSSSVVVFIPSQSPSLFTHLRSFYLCRMAKTSAFLMALATIVAGTLAEYTGNHGGGHCCRFTLSSHGSFDCPAGELEDGQIRLNGTYDTSTFCIDSEGGITNSRGFGCIVTGE